MTWHKEIWTYLIVTVVAVLIWAWAASETREQRTIASAKVQFEVQADPGNWLIEPQSISPSVVVEGTRLSVQEVSNLLRQSVTLPVATNDPTPSIDIAAMLRSLEAVKQTGATIVSTEPARIELTLDQVDRQTSRVRAVLPGVTPEGEIVITPSEVSVVMPHSLRQRLPADFRVEAFVPASTLEQLDRGVPQTLTDVRLRMPEPFASDPHVQIQPPSVRLNFTIRSRIRETRVDSARLMLDTAPENLDGYLIEVEPNILRGVTVLADADLARKIESGETPVVAVLHLKSSEIEALIERKEISYFRAQETLPGGRTNHVQLGIKPGTPMPTINLKITRRTAVP